MSLPVEPMENPQASTMNIHDFRKIFNIFNNFLVAFGLSSLQPFYKYNQINYKLSYKCVVYSIVISALIIYVFYVQIMAFTIEKDSLVISFLNLYLTVVGTLMAILMVTTAIFNANNFAELINDYEYFEIFTLLKSYRILIWASAKQLFLSFSILSLCYMWDLLSTGEGFDFGLAIYILMYFLFPIYNSLCISQFYITLFWLGQLYLIVNKGLIRLAGKNEIEDAVVNINQLPSYIIFGISEMSRSYESLPPTLLNQCGENSQSTKMASIATEMKIKELQTLRKIYHKLFKLTSKINYIFASRNLLLILHHCALGTVYLYWAIRHSLPGIEISMTKLLNLYRASVMSLVSIMWLIWPSTTTVQEVNRTALLVHQLLSTAKCPEFEKELLIFSLQLIQEPVSFTPHGFFNLSYNALLSMLAAVTSYLVILLQYHMMYLELQSKINNNNNTFQGDLNFSNETFKTFMSN